MRNALRSLVLLACIASTTAFGSQIVFADDAAATTPPQAQGHHQGHHRRHGDSFRRLAKELGFTELQKTQLKALYKTNQA
jgi:Spy/CpxP family protein refolding chaperone